MTDSLQSSSSLPRAIILAAGVGWRLGNAAPKVLLDFEGKTLLERHLATLHANGIGDIAVTVGHRGDLIRSELSRIGALDRVALVENPRYREGSVVSLAVQRPQLAAGRPVLLMDGDVLYDGRMIARLLQAAPENVLLFDQVIEPGDEPVKICLRGELIVDFAKVPEHAHDRQGESVGFFRFSASMATALAERATASVEGGRAGAEYEAAIRDLILAHPNRFGCEDISDLPWIEIDFEADVAKARLEILPQLQEVADITTRKHGAAEPSNSPNPVFTAKQVASYREQGWLLARGFVAPPEVEALARWTDELVARPEEPGKHMVYRESSLRDPASRVIQRIENFCPFHAEYDAFVRDGRLRQAVDQLFGDAPACLFKEKINFKMPGGAGFEPHQDQQAGWSRYASMFITAMVTIDRATIENGCLEMGNGARLTGLIGAEWRPLTAEEMKCFSLVPVPTEPGDVLFFDSYAPHASKPNMTDRPRRVLYLSYNAAAEGDHRARYFAEKRESFPPDVERRPGIEYKFRV